MPGKSSRDKGGRVERELVQKLRDAGFPDTFRVPLSGAAEGFKGDINIKICNRKIDSETLVAEVKARKDGTGFKQLEDWKGDHDYLFLKRNNSDPMVAMDWDEFVRLLALAYLP
jgi:Holliday junction resolvase